MRVGARHRRRRRGLPVLVRGVELGRAREDVGARLLRLHDAVARTRQLFYDGEGTYAGAGVGAGHGAGVGEGVGVFVDACSRDAHND